MSRSNLAYYTDVLTRKRIDRVFHINRSKAIKPDEVDLDAYPWWAWYEVERSQELTRSEMRTVDREGRVRSAGSFPILMQYLRRRA